MKISGIVMLCGGVLLATPAMAATVVDFDTHPVVTTATGLGPRLDSFSVGSVTATVSATNKAGTTALSAGLFDTVNSTNSKDTDIIGPFLDLGGANPRNDFGRAVILLGPDQGGGVPDDLASGGIVTFTFSGSVLWSGLTVLDVEENDLQVFVDGTFFGEVGSADSRYNLLTLNKPVRIEQTLSFRFDGSGAIDDLQLSPVPLPAALPMLAGVLGLGAYAARRSRQS